MVSKDPPKHRQKQKSILEELILEAQSLLTAAAHYEGPMDKAYRADYRFAWEFVKKVARLEED